MELKIRLCVVLLSLGLALTDYVRANEKPDDMEMDVENAEDDMQEEDEEQRPPPSLSAPTVRP